MMTVKQVSKLTGVSIRTLQYYDRIGLLKATAYTEARYRLYDDAALERLQQILLFRELEFSLKDIQTMLSSPHFDRQKALDQQIRLLTMKKERLEALISLALGISLTGGKHMDFSAFDKTKLNRYAQEAREQWGQTAAYAEFSQKNQGRSDQVQQALGQGLMAIFAELGQVKSQDPAEAQARALVKKLQDYITANYYHCTNQILLGLGQMYAAGGAFTENIDAIGGEGTADFANQAMIAYCAK